MKFLLAPLLGGLLGWLIWRFAPAWLHGQPRPLSTDEFLSRPPDTTTR